MTRKKKFTPEQTANVLIGFPYDKLALALLNLPLENGPSYAEEVQEMVLKDVIPTLEHMSFSNVLLFEQTMDQIKEIHPNLYRNIREDLDVRYMLRIVKEAEDGKEAWYHMLEAWNNGHQNIVFRAMDILKDKE